MHLTVEQIREILRLVQESGCEEFRLETTDLKLIVRKSGAGAAVASARAVPAAAVTAPELAAAPQPVAANASAPPREEPVPDGWYAVRAPMVGTFYRAPAPGAPPFVDVGSHVKEQDTVCILEVMKLMTSLAAGARGRVARICVENAALVAQGQALLLIEPEALA